MAKVIFNILKKEGVLTNVLLFFFLFSPIYLLDMFLIIPLALLLLHREMLNLTAPSEQLVVLYHLFGLPIKVILCSNIWMIGAVNLINLVILAFSTFYVGDAIHLFDYLNQILVLNGALLFAVAFGNGVLYHRLTRSAYYTIHKVVIVSLFLFSVLMVFALLFLIREQSMLAGAMFLLVFLIWIISVFVSGPNFVDRGAGGAVAAMVPLSVLYLEFEF